MQRGATGEYEVTTAGEEQVRAFIPHHLPPNPPLDLSNARQRLLERATLAVGRLDSITLLLPEPNIFLYAYVRREAVLSSQIEGTQSSLAACYRLLAPLPTFSVPWQSCMGWASSFAHWSASNARQRNARWMGFWLGRRSVPIKSSSSI